jgi:catechol 2,3-dioxygenase-like lactoylglutathione lyase family enzyme
MSQFFGKSIHTAFIVPDVEQAVQRMADSGVGPFFMLRKIKPMARYRGTRHDVLETVAFFYDGGTLFEFLQQLDDTPSAFKEFLARRPQGGLHHQAYYCDNFDLALKQAAARGTEFRVVQEFITADGSPFEIYIEPVGKPDPLLVQLSLPGTLPQLFGEMERIAASWDGKDPIRNALDLFPPEVRALVEPM